MDSHKDKFNIHECIQIVHRRKWFFIIPLAVIYISFLAGSFFLPKIYEARAIILVEEKKVVNPLLQNLVVSNTVAERLNTLREEMLAWPRLYQLVQRLNLNKNTKTPLELERLILEIKKNIKLTMKSHDVVIVNYQGKERRGTQKLVNTLCDILIERNLSLINEDTASAIDFIDEQLEVYKGKLNKAEGSLREFKEIYGLDVLPSLQSTEAGFTAPIVQVSSEIAKIEAQIVLASVDCTDEHPRIKDLKRKMASLREKRDLYIQQTAERTGVDPTSYVAIAGSLPRQQEELARLSRDKSINEKIYEMLLQRFESAKITESLDASENRTKFRIIEPARLPLFSVKPNKAKLNILGLILGGMFGFGCTYVVEFTDSSFKNADQVKAAFCVPVLGNIPKILTQHDLDKQGAAVKKVLVITLIVTLLATALSVVMAHFGLGFAKLMG